MAIYPISDDICKSNGILWGIMYPNDEKQQWYRMATDDIWKMLGISYNIGIP